MEYYLDNLLKTMQVTGSVVDQGSNWSKHFHLSYPYWEAAQIDSEDSNMDLIHLLLLFPQYYKSGRWLVHLVNFSQDICNYTKEGRLKLHQNLRADVAIEINKMLKIPYGDYGHLNVPLMTWFVPKNDKKFTTNRQVIYQPYFLYN